MNIILQILMIYGLAFVIGMFVAAIIWLLYTTMSSDNIKHFRPREAYHDLKQLRNKRAKEK